MTDSTSKQARMNALLNRKRKIEICGEPTPSTSGTSAHCDDQKEQNQGVTTSDEEKRKATEAILRDAKRAKQRAEMVGPQGWLRPKSLNTNKQFLHRALAATLPDRKPKLKKPPGSP
ncbi:hypothetical protein Q1695_006415 [Nippostrongylus brasiliensis]|nr:hypothetical protein Q1695_006415 [Nippostrongylus brasiliensis]